MFLFNTPPPPHLYFNLHLEFKLTSGKSVLRKKHRVILQLHHFIILSTQTMYKCWKIEVSQEKLI